MYMRSNDVPLGLPYNIASYALLTYMIAHLTNLTPGELIISLGDAHIYNNQIPGVEEQLTRTPGKFPTIRIDEHVNNIDEFNMSSITLENYFPQKTIKFPFSV